MSPDSTINCRADLLGKDSTGCQALMNVGRWGPRNSLPSGGGESCREPHHWAPAWELCRASVQTLTWMTVSWTEGPLFAQSLENC